MRTLNLFSETATELMEYEIIEENIFLNQECSLCNKNLLVELRDKEEPKYCLNCENDILNALDTRKETKHTTKKNFKH